MFTKYVIDFYTRFRSFFSFKFIEILKCHMLDASRKADVTRAKRKGQKVRNHIWLKERKKERKKEREREREVRLNEWFTF